MNSSAYRRSELVAAGRFKSAATIAGAHASEIIQTHRLTLNIDTLICCFLSA
jgi:hypothetical protein